jgi:hypothetical protein
LLKRGLGIGIKKVGVGGGVGVRHGGRS